MKDEEVSAQILARKQGDNGREHAIRVNIFASSVLK